MPAEGPLDDGAAGEVVDWIRRYPKARSRVRPGAPSLDDVRSALCYAAAVIDGFAGLGTRRQRVIVDMVLTFGTALVDETRGVILARSDCEEPLAGGGATASSWIDEDGTPRPEGQALTR
jgi:hypothetical protein